MTHYTTFTGLLIVILLFCRIAKDYEVHSEKALGDSDKYLSNPLNAFLLVKRFTSEWEDGVVSLIKSNNSADGELFPVKCIHLWQK